MSVARDPSRLRKCQCSAALRANQNKNKSQDNIKFAKPASQNLKIYNILVTLLQLLNLMITPTAIISFKNQSTPTLHDRIKAPFMTE